MYLSVASSQIFSPVKVERYTKLSSHHPPDNIMAPFSPTPSIFQEGCLLCWSPGACITVTFANQELLYESPYGIQ